MLNKKLIGILFVFLIVALPISAAVCDPNQRRQVENEILDQAINQLESLGTPVSPARVDDLKGIIKVQADHAVVTDDFPISPLLQKVVELGINPEALTSLDEAEMLQKVSEEESLTEKIELSPEIIKESLEDITDNNYLEVDESIDENKLDDPNYDINEITDVVASQILTSSSIQSIFSEETLGADIRDVEEIKLASFSYGTYSDVYQLTYRLKGEENFEETDVLVKITFNTNKDDFSNEVQRLEDIAKRADISPKLLADNRDLKTDENIGMIFVEKVYGSAGGSILEDIDGSLEKEKFLTLVRANAQKNTLYYLLTGNSIEDPHLDNAIIDSNGDLFLIDFGLVTPVAKEIDLFSSLAYHSDMEYDGDVVLAVFDGMVIARGEINPDILIKLRERLIAGEPLNIKNKDQLDFMTSYLGDHRSSIIYALENYIEQKQYENAKVDLSNDIAQIYADTEVLAGQEEVQSIENPFNEINSYSGNIEQRLGEIPKIDTPIDRIKASLAIIQGIESGLESGNDLSQLSSLETEQRAQAYAQLRADLNQLTLEQRDLILPSASRFFQDKAGLFLVGSATIPDYVGAQKRLEMFEESGDASLIANDIPKIQLEAAINSLQMHAFIASMQRDTAKSLRIYSSLETVMQDYLRYADANTRPLLQKALNDITKKKQYFDTVRRRGELLLIDPVILNDFSTVYEMTHPELDLLAESVPLVEEVVEEKVEEGISSLNEGDATTIIEVKNLLDPSKSDSFAASVIGERSDASIKAIAIANKYALLKTSSDPRIRTIASRLESIYRGLPSKIDNALRQTVSAKEAVGLIKGVYDNSMNQELMIGSERKKYSEFEEELLNMPSEATESSRVAEAIVSENVPGGLERTTSTTTTFSKIGGTIATVLGALGLSALATPASAATTAATISSIPVLPILGGIVGVGVLGYVGYQEIKNRFATQEVQEFDPTKLREEGVPANYDPTNYEDYDIVTANAVNLNELPVGTIIEVKGNHISADYQIRIDEGGMASIWGKEKYGNAIVLPIEQLVSDNTPGNNYYSGVLSTDLRTVFPYYDYDLMDSKYEVRKPSEVWIDTPQMIVVAVPKGETFTSQGLAKGQTEINALKESGRYKEKGIPHVSYNDFTQGSEYGVPLIPFNGLTEEQKDEISENIRV